MKNTLFLLAGATVLSLASCSEKKTETTETTHTVMTGDPNTAVVMDNEEMYKQRSMRVANKYIADLKVMDAAMQEKIRTAYYNRSKRYGEARMQYKADTTGMAAAMREANMATDAEFKTIYTDPTQYQAYESSRSTYDESNYLNDNSTTGGDAMSSDASGATGAADASTSNMTSVEEGKTKMADGSKTTVSANGDIKVKDAEGNKTKVDGDDGTVKIKPVGEEKTKIK